MTETLRAALDAEGAGRFLDALQFANRAVAEAPDDPDALNLLGRLAAAGDLTAAIGLQRLALRLAPDHARAHEDLAAALAARPDPARGEQTYADALRRAPDLAVHHRLPWAREPFSPEPTAELEALLDEAVRADPALAGAHAAQANLRVRAGRFAEAAQLYRRALLLDADDPELQLGAAELALALNDEGAATHHRTQALARRRLYPAAQLGQQRSVLMLVASDSWSAHIPLDLVVDHDRTALHRLYVAEPPQHDEHLPHYDIIFTAMRESDAARTAQQAAGAFIAGQDRPALNDPTRLPPIARGALGTTLAQIDGIVVAPARRIPAYELQTAPPLAFPFLIRPPDTHAGKGLARLDDAAQLAAYLKGSLAATYDCTAFVEYRSADGWYRKYRVMLIDGIPYAYHLAISETWMVHYQTSATHEHAWMRAEEERFVDDPRSVFPDWDRVFGALAHAIGLDYVGVDCALLADGRVLIFEADAAMLVHALDEGPESAYKRRSLDRIIAGIEQLIDERTTPRRAS